MFSLVGTQNLMEVELGLILIPSLKFQVTIPFMQVGRKRTRRLRLIVSLTRIEAKRGWLRQTIDLQ